MAMFVECFVLNLFGPLFFQYSTCARPLNSFFKFSDFQSVHQVNQLANNCEPQALSYPFDSTHNWSRPNKGFVRLIAPKAYGPRPSRRKTRTLFVRDQRRDVESAFLIAPEAETSVMTAGPSMEVGVHDCVC